jgi:hypothetical protein
MNLNNNSEVDIADKLKQSIFEQHKCKNQLAQSINE